MLTACLVSVEGAMLVGSGPILVLIKVSYTTTINLGCFPRKSGLSEGSRSLKHLKHVKHVYSHPVW